MRDRTSPIGIPRAPPRLLRLFASGQLSMQHAMAQSLPHPSVCKTPSTPDDASQLTAPPSARPLVQPETAPGIKHRRAVDEICLHSLLAPTDQQKHVDFRYARRCPAIV